MCTSLCLSTYIYIYIYYIRRPLDPSRGHQACVQPFDPQLWSLITDLILNFDLWLLIFLNLPQFQFQCWNLWPLGVESRDPKGVSICRGGSPNFWEKCDIFLNSFLVQLVCDLKSFLGPSGRPSGIQKAQHGQPLTFPMSIWKVNSRWILTIFNLVFFFKEKTFFGSKRPFRATFAGTYRSKWWFGVNLGPLDDPLEHPGAPKILHQFWNPFGALRGHILAPLGVLKGAFRYHFVTWEAIFNVFVDDFKTARGTLWCKVFDEIIIWLCKQIVEEIVN